MRARHQAERVERRGVGEHGEHTIQREGDAAVERGEGLGIMARLALERRGWAARCAELDAQVGTASEARLQKDLSPAWGGGIW